MADNIELSYPQMTRQREENIQSQQVAKAEDVNVELDHIVETYNRLIMLLTGEWGDGTGKIYEMVDNAIAVANEAKAIADNCVKKTGDTLTGLLSCAVVPNSDYNLVNKKYVDDKIITELADPLGRIESLENFRDNLKAEQVKLENSNFSATNLHDGMTELFISVSSGKATVAAAITGKGIETAADASFKTMADNINAILTFNEGTASGTATPADILSGKTAYARGQLIIGSLNLNGLYDTSDSTATPYDIAIGKVAYGNNGRIVGALNISDDGNISYDTDGVKKIYGYASNTISAKTAYNSFGLNGAPSIAVNKNTGDAEFKIEVKSCADGIITFVTHRITRGSDNSFIYANEKETTLEITEISNYEDIKKVICTQVSDCSNVNEVYLHLLVGAKSTSISTNAIIVCKMKRTAVDTPDGGKIYYWEIDKDGGFWYKKNMAYVSTKYVAVAKIVISSIGNRSGKYGILVVGSTQSNTGTGLITYKIDDGANTISSLSGYYSNIVISSYWGMFGMFLGYNDRFLCIIYGTSSTENSTIYWLSEDFTIQNSKGTGYYKKIGGFISPDGKLLIRDRYIYDFSGAIDKAFAAGELPSTSATDYKVIGTLSKNGVGFMSPSSNIYVQYASVNPQENSGARTYIANYLDTTKEEIVTGSTVYGGTLGVIGDNKLPYDYFSNDGSIYFNTYTDSSNNKRDVIIKFERDYSEIIALEYEGDYYYKSTYTGDLTPGGES